MDEAITALRVNMFTGQHSRLVAGSWRSSQHWPAAVIWHTIIIIIIIIIKERFNVAFSK